MSLKNVLAIETSTAACSVALIYNEKTYSCHEILPQKHAHRVLEMVDEVLHQAGIDSGEINLLAYGEGPGAFTGVRIASGVIQGLALGWNKPVIAISSLLAMAEETLSKIKPEKDLSWASLLDARMNEVYLMTGTYNAQNKEILSDNPILIPPREVTEYIPNVCELGIGDTDTEYPDLKELFNDWSSLLPNAVSIARLAITNSNHSTNANANSASYLDSAIPNPLYLRNHIADTIEERKQKKLSAEAAK
ncbi:tRNA (adenosine(37)-N6)-threonylcarbamoyltransferase complex dimerization subunit type 1 TsaB [Thiomicrorhabdus sp. Milos-T2]|uniref:tRNA (adenosine(37)-N6)-threonylcarbamoyltransferase complex dimerization subunit type 1 TsaB n=1 Tax=Thiomicrorhabdus sp. Milos-T2 TaxID=90814 RepID=UPI00131A1AFD|nr:tRNA (adenosine(37)-N6)-threonylcarbamoyltransferase complex dimerization subunit type 1 TsaB [Thiomicrorhabdus sp. Milos-T2]